MHTVLYILCTVNCANFHVQVCVFTTKSSFSLQVGVEKLHCKLPHDVSKSRNKLNIDTVFNLMSIRIFNLSVVSASKKRANPIRRVADSWATLRDIDNTLDQSLTPRSRQSSIIQTGQGTLDQSGESSHNQSTQLPSTSQQQPVPEDSQQTASQSEVPLIMQNEDEIEEHDVILDPDLDDYIEAVDLQDTFLLDKFNKIVCINSFPLSQLVDDDATDVSSQEIEPDYYEDADNFVESREF